MKNSIFIAQNDRVQASQQASKPASQQASKPASQPLLCTVTNTAYARAYTKFLT